MTDEINLDQVALEALYTSNPELRALGVTLQALYTHNPSDPKLQLAALTALYRYFASDPKLLQVSMEALVIYGQPVKPAAPTVTVSGYTLTPTIGGLTQYTEWLDLEVAPEISIGFPGAFTLLSDHMTPHSSLDDVRVTPGYYYYRVVARNIANHTYSDPSIRAYSPGIGSVDLLYVTGGCAGIGYLNWQLATLPPTFQGYNVYSSDSSGGPYTKVNDTLIEAMTYAVSGLSIGVPTFFVVRVVVSAGEGGNSSEVSLQALPTPTAPFHLSAIPNVDSIYLDWG